MEFVEVVHNKGQWRGVVGWCSKQVNSLGGVVLRAAKVIFQGWVVLGETMGVASVVQCLDILSELMMHVVGGGHMEN
jgi:hypothetical protein